MFSVAWIEFQLEAVLIEEGILTTAEITACIENEGTSNVIYHYMVSNGSISGEQLENKEFLRGSDCQIGTIINIRYLPSSPDVVRRVSMPMSRTYGVIALFSLMIAFGAYLKWRRDAASNS